MHKKALVKNNMGTGEEVWRYINPATGVPIVPNPIVNGTKNRPVTPTNPLIDTRNKAAGCTQCDSEVVIINDHPADGLRIGDFYTTSNGVEWQVVGIGSNGNPITGAGRQGLPDYTKDDEDEQE